MGSKKILWSVIAGICFLAGSCAFLNITNLKGNEYAFIPKGDEAGNVSYKIDEFGLEELSCYVYVFDDIICTVDNVNKRIQVMEQDGTVKMILGSIPPVNSKSIKTSRFNFITIGSVYMDDQGNLYVQNRLSPSSQRISRSGGMKFSPSYVLVFNKNGVLQYSLGQTGSTQNPFYQIETIDVDSKGRLMIISRTFDVWNVYNFSGKKLNYHINLGNLDFNEKEDDKEYIGKIENVKMYGSGEVLLISVAYYHGLRLKYRKVFNYSTSVKNIVRTVFNIPDPKNVLFNIVDDKLIYFWNMEENVRFAIYNLEGTIASNVKLEIDNSNTYYTGIQGDRSGNLYTFHIKNNGIQIYEWE